MIMSGVLLGFSKRTTPNCRFRNCFRPIIDLLSSGVGFGLESLRPIRGCKNVSIEVIEFGSSVIDLVLDLFQLIHHPRRKFRK